MTRQLAHMGHLVAELAQASRIEDDASPRDRVPMRSIVRRAFEMASGAHELRRHEVALCLPNEELYVLGDETHLSQIVSNLLTNAAKYTPDGGSIDVTLSRRRRCIAGGHRQRHRHRAGHAAQDLRHVRAGASPRRAERRRTRHRTGRRIATGGAASRVRRCQERRAGTGQQLHRPPAGPVTAASSESRCHGRWSDAVQRG